MQSAQEQARSLIDSWIVNTSPVARAEVLNTLTETLTRRGLAVMFHFGAELQQLEDTARRADDYNLADSYDLAVVAVAMERFAQAGKSDRPFPPFATVGQQVEDKEPFAPVFDVVQPEGSDVLPFAAAH
jgi:hypothetical protein